MTVRTKRLPLLIPSDEYQRLSELGRRELRDPAQQAMWLLKQALGAQPTASTTSPMTESATERTQE